MINFAGYSVSVLILSASLSIATQLIHSLHSKLLHISFNTTLKSTLKNTAAIESSQSSYSEEKEELHRVQMLLYWKIFYTSFCELGQIPSAFSGFVPPFLLSLGVFFPLLFLMY